MSKTLKVGDTAPAFCLPDANNRDAGLEDLIGKRAVREYCNVE